MMTETPNIQEKGQVLLLVVVTMTIALALGVGVSLQTLQTLTGVSNTDTAQKALATAEGGAERFLSLTDEQQSSWVKGTDDRANICDSIEGLYDESLGVCIFDFPAETGSNLPTQAYVSAESFSTNTADGWYEFNVSAGQVKQVILNDTDDVELCWNENQDVGLYYIIYNELGHTERQLVRCHNEQGALQCPTGNPYGWTSPNAVFATNGTSNGYNSCYTIEDFPSNPTKLRIYPIGADAVIAVRTSNLPEQGVKITAEGRLQNFDTAEGITKRLSVYKSFTYPPSIFDFAIFSEGTLDTD